MHVTAAICVFYQAKLANTAINSTASLTKIRGVRLPRNKYDLVLPTNPSVSYKSINLKKYYIIYIPSPLYN